MDWTLVAATTDGHALGELTGARGRGLSFDLRGPATVKFNLDGRSAEARDLHELATDLFVWREKERIFRGRLGSGDDDVDSDRHACAFSAVDYRGVLGGRIEEHGRTFEDVQQAEIGWQLVQVAQEGDGGPLGITRGTGRPAEVARTETIDVDTPLDKALERFEDYRDGFEWWIDPELEFQQATWRGIEHPDFPLAWGTSVATARRQVDTGLYANWVRVRGGRPEGAEQDEPELHADRWAPDLATLPHGRIARVVSNSELTDQQAVDDAADQLLADSLNPPAAYTVTLKPGLWRSPADVWLGDTLPLIIRSGRLEVARSARVSLLDIDLDEDGRESVNLTVGTGE